ncbi:MAG: transporter [Phycisphaeraceae bacterium]
MSHHSGNALHVRRPVARRWFAVVAMIAVIGLTATGARAGDLKNVITDLYGGDGIRIGESTMFSHAAHFTTQSLSGLENLNEALVSSVRFPSFNTVVTGFTLDLETGEPVRTTDSLGPLLAESAITLGKGRINFGASFTHVKFTHFQGDSLKDLRLRFQHPDANKDGMLGPATSPFAFELDEVEIAINLSLDQEIFALFFNYGVTSRWDVGIVVPVVSTRAEAFAVASVVDGTPETPSPHFFGVGGDSQISQTGGRRTGIGDIILRTKYNFLRDHEYLPDMAIAAQVALPTGDDDNLLGTGETQILIKFILAKAIGIVTPHLNIGYEFVPGNDELNNVRLAVGADLAIDSIVTIAFDILGRFAPAGTGIGDNQVDAAFGLKIALTDDVLLNANILIPLNRDEGLRAAYILTVGFEINY